jgi:hypothetical protein
MQSRTGAPRIIRVEGAACPGEVAAGRDADPFSIRFPKTTIPGSPDAPLTAVKQRRDARPIAA